MYFVSIFQRFPWKVPNIISAQSTKNTELINSDIFLQNYISCTYQVINNFEWVINSFILSQELTCILDYCQKKGCPGPTQYRFWWVFCKHNFRYMVMTLSTILRDTNLDKQSFTFCSGEWDKVLFVLYESYQYYGFSLYFTIVIKIAWNKISVAMTYIMVSVDGHVGLVWLWGKNLIMLSHNILCN